MAWLLPSRCFLQIFMCRSVLELKFLDFSHRIFTKGRKKTENCSCLCDVLDFQTLSKFSKYFFWSTRSVWIIPRTSLSKTFHLFHGNKKYVNLVGCESDQQFLCSYDEKHRCATAPLVSRRNLLEMESRSLTKYTFSSAFLSVWGFYLK